MKKTLDILFYTGLSMVGFPTIILFFFIFLHISSEKKEINEEVRKVYDTVTVKKVVKIYDTVYVKKTKWIEKVKTDTIN
jgi:hypothetical protein